MYNELFESVIRTSGENTNDIDDFDDRDNFWAPIPENLLFERVLREVHLQEMPIASSQRMINWVEKVLQNVIKRTNGFLKRLPENELLELDKEIEKLFTSLIYKNHVVEKPFALLFNTNNGESLLAANKKHYNALKKAYTGYLIIEGYNKNGEADIKLIEKWFDLIIGELRPKEGQDGFEIINRYYEIIKKAFVDIYKDLPDLKDQSS